MAEIKIGGRLHSVAVDQTVANSDEIYDKVEQKKQEDINAELRQGIAEAGNVDDVIVNGEPVVQNKVANITMPTKVSDLSNDVGFAKTTEVVETINGIVDDLQNQINAKQATITATVNPTVTEDGGEPSASMSFQNGQLGFAFQNLKGDPLTWNDLTDAQKASLKGRPGADRQPVEAGDVIIAHSLGGDEEKVMSQNAVSEALGSQALGSGLYEEVGNLSNMSELTAKAISNVGIITNSTSQGAKIVYFEVTSGDIVKINLLAQSTTRIAWGLFPDLNVDTEALQYENYVANDLTIGKDYLFHVASAGYFAIYSLNAYEVSVLRGKGGMVSRKIAYKTLSGGGIYVANMPSSSYGTVGTNVNRRYTDYIDVSQIKKLLYTRQASAGSAGDNFGLAFYNSSKGFVGGESALKSQYANGYVLSLVDVPSNAKYARFTLWENPNYGDFFFCDADADAMGINIAETITADVSAKKITIQGKGTIAVSSQKIYAKPERVLRFVLDDNNVPLTDSSTDERFVVAAFDSTDNLVENLYMVKNPDLPRKEILVVTPQAFDHIKVGVKCNEGEEYSINISDVTDSYTRKKLDGKDIKGFSLSGSTKARRHVLVDAIDGNILRAFPKNATNYTTACYLYEVEEHVASYAETPSAFVDGVHQVASYGNGDFLNLNFKKGNGEIITKEDVLAAYDIYLYYTPKGKGDLHLEDSERKWELYGFSEYNASANDRGVHTNYLTIPKVGMSVRMDIPKWLKVRFKCGTREESSREYTDYFYSDDIATFISGQAVVMAEFSCIHDRVLDKDFYDESMSLTILDENDGDVIKRNFDTEKLLGAIEATPTSGGTIDGITNALPLIVHVSDVHADVTRFKSACDYADYLGADLLVNTGDNPFFTMDDGTDFHQEIVDGLKSQYATCLGNHDTYRGVSLANMYSLHMAPFAQRYGYHKSNGSDVTDTFYYYKDLEDKKLRIIALNIYDQWVHANQKARMSLTQINWLASTLASTPEGYGVIIMSHQAPHGIGTIEGKTSWNDADMYSDCASIDSSYMYDSDNLDGRLTGNPICKIVDAFIGRTSVSGSYNQLNTNKTSKERVDYSADFSNVAEGVEFICHINGHTHRDWIGYVKDCEHNQLNINLCSAAPISQGSGLKTPTDIFRDSNGVNQDAFNVYTINREDKTVGIVRIGSCITKGLQERRVTFVSYV